MTGAEEWSVAGDASRSSDHCVELAISEDVARGNQRFGTEADGIAGLGVTCRHGLSNRIGDN